MNIIKNAVYRLFSIIGQEINHREYINQQSDEVNERAIEYSYALQCAWRTSAHSVLDVGSGYSPWPSLLTKCGYIVTAIDPMEGYWGGSIFNRHFYIVKDDITKPKLSKKFDLITCISTLEHIPNHQDAMRGMFSLLKPGGHLVLTFPYNELHYVNNAYKLPDVSFSKARGNICQIFSRKEIDSWLKSNHFRIIEQLYFELFTGQFHLTGDWLSPPREVSVDDKHDLTLILMQRT